MRTNQFLAMIALTVAGGMITFSCSSTRKMTESKPVAQVQHEDTGMVQQARNPENLWFYGSPLYEVNLRALSKEGSFAALTARLDDYKAMGINNLWLMPIYPVGVEGRKGSAGSPYSVRDYFAVGEEYGTKDDFAKLVQAAHTRGMKIILDVVMNHSANDYPLMADHPDWWMCDSTGAFAREVADWADVTDWNYDNDEACAYLQSALEFWVREYDVDGYRCDVAGMVPNDFWTPVIRKLHEMKPDIFMLAEWEDYSVFKAGFDAGYDWTLFHRMRTMREGKAGLDSLWRIIDGVQNTLPDGKEMMCFVENHDEQRSAKTFGWPEVKPYASLVFTLPGIPLIYTGQEIGETRKPSLFDPEPIAWDSAKAGVKPFYSELVRLRNENPALRNGDLRRVRVNTPDVLMFARENDRQHLLVAINFSGEEQTVTLPPVQAKRVWSERTGDGGA
ncbi:MAG: alpha-amylase family glycosyl hydrolase, partial [bacterium]